MPFGPAARSASGRAPRAARTASALLLLLVLTQATAARAETGHHPVNLSFLYPISTNGSPDISTNFRLNLFYARAAVVRGVDLGGLVARTDRDFRGLELAGAHSWIGGPFQGVAATAGVSVIGAEAGGLQLAGLVNFDRADFGGIQVAGLFNSVDGDFRGLQYSSFYNLCGGDVRWLQISSIANVCGGSAHGVQLGVFNFVARQAAGIQLGACNFATQTHGVQAGLLNLARDARGSQIGVVNLAQRLDGVPLGLVNVTHDDGETNWLVLGSSLAGFSVGARTAVRGVYSMVTVGTLDLHDDRSNTLFLDWHYGYSFRAGQRSRWGGDLGFVHIIPHPSDDPLVNDRLHFAIQPRLVGERRVGERMRVVVGAGASLIWNEYSSHATSDTDPLLVLGVSFE